MNNINLEKIINSDDVNSHMIVVNIDPAIKPIRQRLEGQRPLTAYSLFDIHHPIHQKDKPNSTGNLSVETTTMKCNSDSI